MSGGGNDHNGRGGQSPTSSQHGNLPVAETVLPFMFYVQAGNHKRSRSKPFQIDVMGAKILTTDSRLGDFLPRTVQKVWDEIFECVFNWMRRFIHSELMNMDCNINYIINTPNIFIRATTAVPYFHLSRALIYNIEC